MRRIHPGALVWLFGSRARGEAGDDSDYDLCVVSAGFEGLKPWERTEPLVAAWPIEGPVELVAYTPAEWERLATWTFPSTIRTEGREIEPQPQPGCTAADPAETT